MKQKTIYGPFLAQIYFIWSIAVQSKPPQAIGGYVHSIRQLCCLNRSEKNGGILNVTFSIQLQFFGAIFAANLRNYLQLYQAGWTVATLLGVGFDQFEYLILWCGLLKFIIESFASVCVSLEPDSTKPQHLFNREVNLLTVRYEFLMSITVYQFSNDQYLKFILTENYQATISLSLFINILPAGVHFVK